MPGYFVEHTIPHAGELTTGELQAITQQSLDVLHKLEAQIKWLHSTITDNKIYCLYIAPDERVVVEHARRCGLPIQQISEVSAIIDPNRAMNKSEADYEANG
jgi:hypothetical protein